MLRRFVWIGVIALAGCAGTSTPTATSSSTAPRANGRSSTTFAASTTGERRVVDRVVDGDTIIVRPHERVRLIGINTPESVDPNRPVQCFGPEASHYTKSLLPSGTTVRLEYDVDRRDQYGRTLAYVHREPDGLFVNEELVRQGYAQPYTFPPNVRYVDEIKALARQARNANRGLWSKCG